MRHPDVISKGVEQHAGEIAMANFHFHDLRYEVVSRIVEPAPLLLFFDALRVPRDI